MVPETWQPRKEKMAVGVQRDGETETGEREREQRCGPIGGGGRTPREVEVERRGGEGQPAREQSAKVWSGHRAIARDARAAGFEGCRAESSRKPPVSGRYQYRLVHPS